MRNNFPSTVAALLSKRVAHHCSNLHCRQATSGPQDSPKGSINIGVAAHITAASPGGPRYDPSLSADQRRSAENGIWLCQKCSKLIDSDVGRYTVPRLRSWKTEAEEVARVELEAGGETIASSRIARAESLAGDLLTEMRQDLASSPLLREFVLLRRGWVFTGAGETLRYYYDDHPDLDSLVQIMDNLGLILDVTQTNVKRFRISEELADYLTR